MDRSVVVRLIAEVSQYRASMGQASSATADVAKAAEDAGKRVDAAEKGKGKAATEAAATTATAATSSKASTESVAKSAEGAASTTEAATKKVGDSATESGAKVETAFERMRRSMDENRQAWTTAGAALTGFGAAVLGIGAAALRTGINYNQLQQTSRAALTTITGSAEQANAQMDKLDHFASTSPFAKDVFIRAQQQMLGFGVEARKVIPYLDAIQQSVAATGGSNQDIAELSTIFAQISATSKITAQDLNQFGQRGIDAAGLIGEAMGTTGAAIREQITAGTLDAHQALDALAAGMQETYGGAADAVKETLSGAFDRVKAAWRDLSAELASPLVGQEGGGLLIGLLNQTADLMRAFQDLPGPIKGVTAALGGIVGTASLAVGSFFLLAPRIVETREAFRTLRGDMAWLDRGASSIGRFTRAAGYIGLGAVGIYAAGRALKGISDAARGVDRTVQGVADMSMALRGAGTDASYFDSIMGNLATSGALNTSIFSDLRSSVEEVANPNLADRLFMALNLDATGIKEATEAFERTGEAMAALPADEAAEKFRGMWAEMGGGTEAGHELLEVMPAYKEALEAAANEAGLTADEFDILAVATGDLPPAMREAENATSELALEEQRLAEVTRDTTDEIRDQIGAIETLYDLMRESANAFMDANEAQRAWGEDLDGLGKVIEEFGKLTGDALNEAGTGFNDATEAGRFAGEAVDGLAQSGWDLVDALAADGRSAEELETAMAGVRDEVIDLAVNGFGMGQTEAEAYADSLGLIPEDVRTHYELNSEEALETLARLKEQVELMPNGTITINGETLDAEAAIEEVARLANTTEGTIWINGNEVPVEEAYDRALEMVEGGAAYLSIDGDPNGYWSVVTDTINETAQSDASLGFSGDSTEFDLDVEAARQNAADSPASLGLAADPSEFDTTFSEVVSEVEMTTAIANIDADDFQATFQLEEWEALVNGTTGVAGLDAEDDGAEWWVDRWKRDTDRTTGTSGVDAEDRGAEDYATWMAGYIDSQEGTEGVRAEDRGAIRTAEAIRNRISNMSAFIGIYGASQGSPGYATGGPVRGPGTTTSDSIFARLSHDEHVWTAAEVYAAGGHGAVRQMRSAVLAGVGGFATGGPVVGAPLSSGHAPARGASTNTLVNQVNHYTLNVNPRDIDQVRSVIDLVENARRTGRQNAGVRG